MSIGMFRWLGTLNYMKQLGKMIMCSLEDTRLCEGHNICLHMFDGCHIRVCPDVASWNSMSPASQ